jgi:Na+-driven multidrug efflux pump
MYRTLRVPAATAKRIFTKGVPLLINEALWSVGQSLLVQCYSVRGLDVVNGLSIATTISNLFMIIFTTLGSAVAIIVGQLLGRGSMEEARDTDRKLIAFSICLSVLVGAILAALSPFIPRIYKTETLVRELASMLLLVGALEMPINAIANTSYFTIRSGGKTFITFLFDSAYSWVFTIPLAYCLVHFTALPIVPLFFIVRFSGIVKSVIGLVLVHYGFWCQNIVLEK